MASEPGPGRREFPLLLFPCPHRDGAAFLNPPSRYPEARGGELVKVWEAGNLPVFTPRTTYTYKEEKQDKSGLNIKEKIKSLFSEWLLFRFYEAKGLTLQGFSFPSTKYCVWYYL
jgi:hypothetical protein